MPDRRRAVVGIATPANAAFAVALLAYCSTTVDPHAVRPLALTARPAPLNAGLRCLRSDDVVAVPLEVAQPPLRLRALLQTVPLDAVLVTAEHAAAFFAAAGLSIAETHAFALNSLDPALNLQLAVLARPPEPSHPPRPPPPPPEAAYVVFTSGTTGTPKPVYVPLECLATNIQSLQCVCNEDAGKEDEDAEEDTRTRSLLLACPCPVFIFVDATWRSRRRTRSRSRRASASTRPWWRSCSAWPRARASWSWTTRSRRSRSRSRARSSPRA